MRTTAVAVVAMLFGGCVQLQHAVRFTVQRPPEGMTADVARALAGLGHQPVTVDGRLGIVSTAWEDTGFLYGYVDQVAATIVRRYTVTIAPYPSGATLQVRTDSKRCQRGGYTIGDVDIRGACEAMDGIPEAHQSELDALGAQLEAQLGQGAALRPAPAL